jgi:hypothetical protein
VPFDMPPMCKAKAAIRKFMKFKDKKENVIAIKNIFLDSV